MKIATQMVYLVNVLLAVLCFFVCLDYFNRGLLINFILGSMMVVVGICQFFLQKSDNFYFKLVGTIISIAVILIIATVDNYYGH
jgi:hypothetical protein